ncbi:MAG: beta-galactosidase, partial [Limisphaerales bacterium]
AFYQPHATNYEVNQLRLALSQTEEQLDEVRSLYKKLYKKQMTAHLDALDQLLNAATSRDVQNAEQAESLLARIGQELAGKKFNALPVSNADLAPAWSPKLIGKDFKPTRILFGSTGQIGDDRTLPLRFDFGSGVYGAYVPMEAAGKLEITGKRRDRTDGIYPWMTNHREGYHYWAGVYNNQNTYVAPWFLNQHTNDDDIWMRLIDGKIPSRGQWAQVNIWNKDVQSYLTNYCETQGRTFRDDPSLVCYDYTGEPHPFGSQAPGLPQYSGYNDSAVAAFREYLLNKFKTIERLNTEWSTSYKSFTEIQPPADPYVTLEAKATPLSYEFRLFRRDSHTQLWKRVYDAYRKGDPHKPIEANISQYMSGWPVEALDAYGMQKAGAADWVDMHMNNFPPNLAEQIYLYSICRLTGKVPVQFEYVWSFPRTAPFDDNSESDFRATCTSSVWRNLVWGKKALVFFDFYYDWPAYHNAFFDRDVDYSILRPSGCVVPTTKRKMLRFNDLLMTTKVAEPPIIVLQPDASVWNSPALHPNQSFSHHINIARNDVHNVLFPKNYPFLYVPENAVLEDHYDLGKHKVIILPDAPYLPKVMTDKLLAWVKSGGTLLCIGVPGIWTPYGKDDMRLVTTIFGNSEVRDTDPGKWKWSWNITAPNESVKLVRDGDKLAGAFAHYGKGTVLVATANFNNSLRDPFFHAIDSAIGLRPASCSKDSFELVLREDKHGHRFLFALNPSTREVRQDDVVLAGKYNRCFDLGIGSGVPIPVTHDAKTTKISLRLEPGEGTAIELR